MQQGKFVIGIFQKKANSKLIEQLAQKQYSNT